MSRRRVAALALALALAAAAAPVTVVAAATPRTSLPAIEQQVMCAACGVPLDIAESPQADRERAYIQGLIGQGDTVAQIKAALVAQYGPTVLATPPHHGVGLAAYLVPIAVALGLIGLLAALLPRWRRRTRALAAATGAPAATPLSQADAARLDADLARFDR